MRQQCPSLEKPGAAISPTVTNKIHHPPQKSKPPPDAQRAMIATLTSVALRLLLAALGAEATLRLAWRALLEQ